MSSTTVAEQFVQVLRQVGVARRVMLFCGAGARGAHAEVRSALTEALCKPGPVLVDLVTDPNALSVPPHISSDQVTGFALAASKVVLGGGVGRVLDLARSNLHNIPRPGSGL